MGYGRFQPVTRAAFALANWQLFAGLFLNVLVFTVFVTKIQHPEPAIIFSQNALIARRNGQRVLLFRIGNLRANFIYAPTIRVSILKNVVT